MKATLHAIILTVKEQIDELDREERIKHLQLLQQWVQNRLVTEYKTNLPWHTDSFLDIPKEQTT